MVRVWLFVLSVLGYVWSIQHDFKGFDDSILFGIKWPGALNTPETLIDGEATTEAKDILKVTTSLKEKYECHLPELKSKESSTAENYDGPSAISLLKPLFSQKICSYRLDSYWSYEVCHGRYVRQYHEEREGKQIKTQQFSLGSWPDEKLTMLETILKEENPDDKIAQRTTKVEGQSLPYIEMTMPAGTKCDLNDKLRRTKVLYVCYSHGRHEVYSFKETSTCEYEIIILSPLLCQHPKFRPNNLDENVIDCIPVGDAPKKPRNLLKGELESLRFQHQTIKLLGDDKEPRDVLAVLKVEKIDKDGETHLKFELHPLTDEEGSTGETKGAPLIEPPKPITDDSPVRAFLNGENCLDGGTGWWKYEFCYGKHVAQYHVDRAGERTTLMLGKFDEQAHLDWIKENPEKAPKAGKRNVVSHFYTGGDICDKTGKPRQTEVKLKCVKRFTSNGHLSLYLLEPRTCHYILGVETPLICDIINLADENGLIKPGKSGLLFPENTEQKDEDDGDIKQIDVNKFGLD